MLITFLNKGWKYVKMESLSRIILGRHQGMLLSSLLRKKHLKKLCKNTRTSWTQVGISFINIFTLHNRPTDKATQTNLFVAGTLKSSERPFMTLKPHLEKWPCPWITSLSIRSIFLSLRRSRILWSCESKTFKIYTLQDHLRMIDTLLTHLTCLILLFHLQDLLKDVQQPFQ